MDSTRSASDEPTRLAEIIAPVFADQVGGRTTRLDTGAQVDLIAGVPAQDDCAAFRIKGSLELVVGSDYIRGPKFRLYEGGYLNDYDIGYYLAMANFSDIAAMGAQPIALLSVIRYPKTMSDEDFERVAEGIRDACVKVGGAPNVGGDIGTAERLILSASAFGVVEPGRTLYRHGARPGDRLCVTGPTGIAAAAQKYFGNLDPGDTRLSGAEETELLAAWKRPQALVQQGRCLSSSGLATSCQDSSDGLKATIESIAALSGTGFVVEEESLLVPDLVAKVAQLSSSDPTAMLLGDSVDFQLVFTVPAAGLPLLRQGFRKQGLSFIEIGTATGTLDVVLRRSDGTTEPLPGAAWRHAK